MDTFIDTFFSIGGITLFIAGICVSRVGMIVGGIVLFIFWPLLFEGLLNLKGIIKSKGMHQESINKRLSLPSIKIPICYNHRYNISAGGIEKVHPFDASKYRRIFEILTTKIPEITYKTIHNPSKASRELLLTVSLILLNQNHSIFYLFKLNFSLYLTKIAEVPICFIPSFLLRWRLLDPMLYATQGSVDAAILALDQGWAINLSGGYHHASASSGGGFCVYADISIVTKYLRNHYNIEKVCILDLDAHQGNGHEKDFVNDDNVFIADFYNHFIYPGDIMARKSISLDVEVWPKDSDESYIDKLRRGLEIVNERFKPNFLIYNAGTDCLIGDPLGGLQLTADGIKERDELVFTFCLEKKIPILMVLSGLIGI